MQYYSSKLRKIITLLHIDKRSKWEYTYIKIFDFTQWGGFIHGNQK